MVRIQSYFKGLAHVVMIPTVLATSQAGRGAQAQDTHTPEQGTTLFQTSGVPAITPVGVVQSISMASPAMSIDE